MTHWLIRSSIVGIMKICLLLPTLCTWQLVAEAYGPSTFRKTYCLKSALFYCIRYLTPLLSFQCYLASEPVLKAVKPIGELQKAVVGTFAALTIASSAVTNALPANSVTVSPGFTSSMVVAEKVIREGVYGEYSVDVQPQKYDDARSTFKSATETKSKKGKLDPFDISNLLNIYSS
jgi:hypothetical protein